MGSVPNVGLMAQKAEEYGSHDKTFEIAGRRHGARRRRRRQRAARARGRGGRHLARLPGQGRADPRLGEARRHARPRDRRAGGLLARRRPRPRRAADREGRGVPAASTTPTGSRSEILAPVEATRFSLERIRRGEDTISVTGNVLRDYLTDLFPILEVGTSAKMLSIVPLHERRRPVRDRRRRLGAEARAAVREGGPPALGLARRVPGAGRLARAPRRALRQRRGARCSARRSTTATAQLLDEPQGAVAQGARARQPRQPLLPGALLGAGAGGADRRRRRWRRASRRSPRRSPRTRRRSSPS